MASTKSNCFLFVIGVNQPLKLNCKKSFSNVFLQQKDHMVETNRNRLSDNELVKSWGVELGGHVSICM